MDTHIHHDITHNEEHLKSSAALTDIVIGMSDGLTVPFALAAGLSGAIDNSNIIVIAGIAKIAAGSIAMGLGGYLSGKTEQDHYKNEVKRENYEIENLRQKEIAETKEFFAELGLSEEVQNKATDEISRDKNKWVDFMMKYELGLEKTDPKRATKSALNIGISYIVGGIIPLSPYFFIDDAQEALKYSAVTTLLCLFMFGYFKSKITGVNPLLGALRVTLIGAAAAAAAFGVAKLFEH
jgi:VIT1/CCC1 family predicted Fe2+/Mn2+ transporter